MAVELWHGNSEAVALLIGHAHLVSSSPSTMSCCLSPRTSQPSDAAFLVLTYPIRIFSYLLLASGV